MKEKLIALTLLATSGLMAQEGPGQSGASQPNNYAKNNCCEPCDPCEPCCVPKPKKCITCQCYTPPFYDLQCDWGAFLSVDFLYWYARETNLSYAVKVNAVPDTDPLTTVTLMVPSDYRHLNTCWDPGFRVGLGWNSECDGWDWYLNYTYYHNHQRDSSSVDPSYGIGNVYQLPDLDQYALLNPWVNPAFGLFTSSEPNMQTFDKVSAKWMLNFNQIDWELGRKYWLSKCFNLRPYAAIRGAWTKTKFRTKSTRNVASTPLEIVHKNRFTDRYWGVGIVGGLQPTWYFCSNFALYANADVSLIYGEFEVKQKESYFQDDDGTVDANLSYRSKSKFFQMQPIIDLALGLRWEESWCCDQYRTALDLGWEHHVWFDHNHRNKIIEFKTTTDFGGFGTYAENTGNLGMGGFVARLRFDF